MYSWVRYSVAVYLGLMIAGALGLQPPRASQATSVPAPAVMPSPPHRPFPHEQFPQTWRRRPLAPPEQEDPRKSM